MPAYISQNPHNGLVGLRPQVRQPYTPVQDAIVNNAIEHERMKSNGKVEAPFLDPIDFIVGLPMGLANFGVTKAIPVGKATRAMLNSGAYNTAEGAVLNAIDSVPLSLADDTKDYFKAVQGLRRLPLR